MKLKEYITTNNICLKCNSNLKLKIISSNSIFEHHDFEIKEDRFCIYFNTKYFVEPKQSNFRFYILFEGEDIIKTKSMSEYISLYGLDMQFLKICENCKSDDMISGFFYCSYFSYEDKKISFIYGSDGFQVNDDKNTYCFSNNYFSGKSTLVKKDNIKKTKLYSKKLNNIPLEKFCFKSQDKIINKLEKMLILV